MVWPVSLQWEGHHMTMTSCHASKTSVWSELPSLPAHVTTRTPTCTTQCTCTQITCTTQHTCTHVTTPTCTTQHTCTQITDYMYNPAHVYMLPHPHVQPSTHVHRLHVQPRTSHVTTPTCTYNLDCLVPRPRPQKSERVWCTSKEFLGLLTQHTMTS